MKTKLTITAAVVMLAAAPRNSTRRSRHARPLHYGEGFSQDTTGVGERWWELFGDTTLNAFVERALTNNRDVAAAAARVEEARANLRNVPGAIPAPDRRRGFGRGRIHP